MVVDLSSGSWVGIHTKKILENIVLQKVAMSGLMTIKSAVL